MKRKKQTVATIAARKRGKKESGDKLVMCTAYDATFASLLDQAGIDVLLVGDSLGMVIQGHKNTLPVTLEHVIYHCAAVTRGATYAHVVGDMPFMSYQVCAEDALRAAGRLLQEGNAHAVKLEGGINVAGTVKRLVDSGIPVMGHIGLTPQSVHAFGGFKIQGRDVQSARRLLDDAHALVDAGVYSLVLEGIPMEVAGEITASVAVPTIGIGAGPKCDGQVLVCYDLLGMTGDFQPKFLKRFAEIGQGITAAVQDFATEVRQGQFPDDEHSFHSPSLHAVDDGDNTKDDPVSKSNRTKRTKRKTGGSG